MLNDVNQSELRHEDIMHPPVVVPLTKKVDEMFDFFQVNQVRAAACLNEFGGVEGFITMRGVLNFIFGDVSGGSQATAEYYAEKDNNIYEVPGDMKLNDFNNLTNFGIEDPRMTTIAGFAFRLLDRLPREGDQVKSEDIIIQILEMDDHRISRVRVAKGVDEDDFNREERVLQTDGEVDHQAQEREDIDDIPEDVDDSAKFESEDETNLVEKVS